MTPLRIAAVGAMFSALVLAAGDAAAAGPAGPPSTVDWSKAQTVEIDLDSYSIAPKSLHLKKDAPYVLHFVNKSSKGHNFDAPAFFDALMVVTSDQAKVGEGKVELDGGQAIDVQVVPNLVGTYPVTCTHFLHASFGMTGEAVIE